jgi:TRAP-type C4-dicarboxylate transport system permease small subunit
MPTAYSAAWKRGLEFFLIALVPALAISLASLQTEFASCASAVTAPTCTVHWSVFAYALVAAMIGALIKTLLQLIENVHAASAPTVTTTTITPIETAVTKVETPTA